MLSRLLFSYSSQAVQSAQLNRGRVCTRDLAAWMYVRADSHDGGLETCSFVTGSVLPFHNSGHNRRNSTMCADVNVNG